MKKFCAVLFIIIGILSIVLAFVVYDSSVGSYESNEAYGGDAYTGIQNAAAQTANNVKTLAELVSFSSFSVLLVAGLALIAFGLLNFAGPKAPKAAAYAPQPAQYYNPAAVRPAQQPAQFYNPNPARPVQQPAAPSAAPADPNNNP